MRLELESSESLRFDDGSPVRSASAVAPFAGGWLVVQDDATHAAWWRGGSVSAVRVVEPVDGWEVFSAVAGTKMLKPDFEAAAAVTVDGGEGVLLLGSGSTSARTRASLIVVGEDGPRFTVTELAPVYHDVATAMGLRADQLNLEGACVIGDRLRWFQRANLAAGAPTVCCDLSLVGLLAATTGTVRRIDLGGVRHYDLGEIQGVSLAVIDAVALPHGRMLVSAAAEDTTNAVDDGQVVGSAVALLDDERVIATAPIPPGPAGPYKVEGLALTEQTADGLRLLAVTDADDPTTASQLLRLRLRW